ncbi:MAG: hypothetical protein CW716_10275, partial [Candidatus Bathyarchaeum sp.]
MTAVKRRYSRLKRTGIICKESMHLNPASLGYEFIAEVGVITNVYHQEKIAQFLKTIPQLKCTCAIDLTNVSLGKYSLYGLITTKKSNQLT